MADQRESNFLAQWWALDETDQALPITQQERMKITHEALHTWLKSPTGLIAYFLLMASCILIWGVLDWLLTALTGVGDLTKMIAMGAIIPVFIAGMWFIKRFGYRPVLFKILRTRGHNVCLKCGYWLKGLDPTADRCPECGWDPRTRSH